jgi:cyclopropane-fatty-acyl-phospholipid synthase
MDRPPSALAEPVELTAATVSRSVADLPFAARKALEFATRIRIGSLRVSLPDGRVFLFRGEKSGPDAELVVHDLAFARRFADGGDVGIAEAYLRGEWETPNLTRFLELFCANHELIARMLDGKPLIRAWQQFRHWLNRNTKSGSKRNIHAHYDLGNRFYEQWLDGTMTYSAALFDERTPVHHPTDDDLAKGQLRKYSALAEKTMIGPGHHVLEIGCGWGGFAEFAAKSIGCKVTGLTISQEQYDYARKRMFEQGLNDKVEIKFQDYRDERGT